MSIEIDETLQVFIDESIDHLADIENDLLAIEEAGANLDEDLVNKVYRAAHSIKGGAGFMGLTVIQKLTHEMENILGLIRSRELIPTPEIVNILLSASDTLKEMVSDITTSNEVDISHHLELLKAITKEGENGGQESAGSSGDVDEMIEEPVPSEADNLMNAAEYAGFALPAMEIIDALDSGRHVYLIDVDLIADVHAMGRDLETLLNEMKDTGTIITGNVDLEAVGLLPEDLPPCALPFKAVYATILAPEDINILLQLEENRIFQITENLHLLPIDGGPIEADAPEPDQTAKPEPDKSAVAEEEETNVGEPVMNEDHELLSSESDIIEKEAVQSQQSSQNVCGAPKTMTTSSETSLRVNVSLLDSLMNLAGELVLSRNQLLQSLSSDDRRLSEMSGQRIDLITSELQEAIMLTRMQPIGVVFNKFPRVVRDLAQKLGKEVDLVIEGKTVELDKTIIEAINDPLTHLVRNSVDHGIEAPADRMKSGKARVGRVLLKAFHAAGQVNIQITDDGKGLDGDKLAAAAVKKGLLTEEQSRTMSEKEKVSLIFLPGFSTAKNISDVSGRGVGMDVVKTNLEKLGGQTEIESEPGKGTSIGIKLPLTLAIIPSQIVVTEGERYAIPQVSLVELLRIPADKVKERIEKVGDAEVVRLRGNLLPLVRLADVIGLTRTFHDPESNQARPDRRQSIADRRSKESPLAPEGVTDTDDPSGTGGTQLEARGNGDRRYHARSALNIAVVSTGAMKYGVIVDRLYDAEEIVVKPLGRHLKNCKGYAGATIMGDGRVSLILDVGNLAHMAGLTSVEGASRAKDVAQEAKEADAVGNEKQSLLTFRGDVSEQFAVPLHLVERIEKIERKQIETVGGTQVMQYRGSSLPLFSVDQVAEVKPVADTADPLVIVFTIAGREVGLMATGPVDAIDVTLTIDGMTLKQTGIMGSAIIDSHTTLLVDMYELVRHLNPDWFENQEVVANSEGEVPLILYAEDSNFFRSQVKGFMEDAGYRVLEAEDGAEAWDLLLENARDVSLVVTDVEMPNLDGLGLSKKIKSHDQFSGLRVIALTTLAGEDDIARGKAAGIDEYQIKLDREKLIESISTHLNR